VYILISFTGHVLIGFLPTHFTFQPNMVTGMCIVVLGLEKLLVVYVWSTMSECFKEEDVADLVEALADVVHKWEEIALALRLPEAYRVQCKEGSSPVLRLNNVLYKWIVEQHSKALPATVSNLMKALKGPLIKHPDLASQLEEKFKGQKSSPTPLTVNAVDTPDSGLQKYKTKLVKRYLRKAEVPQGVWPPIETGTFINLALVKTRSQPCGTDYSVPGDSDKVLGSKEEITYEKAFGRYSSGEIVLVLGRPGSGKTTLAHKVAKDWSEGRALKEAQLVYVITLRSLNSGNDEKLQDVLQPYYFQEKLLQEISELIEEADGKGVCFIFDGFDEYSFPNKDTSVLYALLGRSYLSDAMVIVTSRPAAASAHLKEESSYKHIEVFGFSKKDVYEYIKCFSFSKSSSCTESYSDQLIKFVKSHPGVLDLC